jgi:chemotaxis protein MotB
MSLLLCFFVLLLSFSELDKAKYKEVAGSLEKAFGVQRKTPAYEAPKGIKMIAKDFDQEVVAIHEREEFVATQDIEEAGEDLKKVADKIYEGSEEQEMVEVTLGENNITIRLMGESTFDSGVAKLKPHVIPLLERVAEILRKTRGAIVISGHTDNVPLKGGPYLNNLRLSVARSTSVAEFFIYEENVAPERISTVGFGEYRPLYPNDTREGRRKNRRVEISISFLPTQKARKPLIQDTVSKKNPSTPSLKPEKIEDGMIKE